MKRTLLLGAIALTLAVPAYAQDPPPSSPWSINAYYSFCQKRLAGVAMNRFDTIDDLFKISWLDVDLSAFAGGSGDKFIGGVAATLSIPLTPRNDWFFTGGLGLDGDFSDLTNINFNKIGLGVTLGISRRF